MILKKKKLNIVWNKSYLFVRFFCYTIILCRQIQNYQQIIDNNQDPEYELVENERDLTLSMYTKTNIL